WKVGRLRLREVGYSTPDNVPTCRLSNLQTESPAWVKRTMFMEGPKDPPGPFRAVLFDVDGTLVDTAELIADSLDYACRRHLEQGYPRETYYGLIGKPAIVQMEILGGARAAEMMEDALAYY